MSEKFYHPVREQLLQLLSSKNEYIRVNSRHFWCDSKRLSTSSHHRLIALVDQLYSIKTENEYLNYSTNLLLECTRHNPDYNHFIFENPLDKCLFQEFPLAYNWRQRHHTYMTPLFTLQSQSIIDPSISITTTNLMTMDPVQFMQTLTQNNNNADQQQSSNSTSSIILQTQEISNRQQFIPTQMLDNNTNYNWLKQTNTLDSINTFMLPTLSTQTKKTNTQINIENEKNDEEDDDIFRLKRRFFKDSGQFHAAYFPRRQNEKKENQVEKYRRYRIGELPDIEIPYSGIIIPLQPLPQYDNHIAPLLYATLFTSILNSLEDKLLLDEYFYLIHTIKYPFDLMLSQSEIFYPLFVAHLLDIVL
ncbi:unnamed protein product [Rotaria sordida]|uniref:DNA-dependent protein kinase catalytic subunit CC5 domain-containing protein n=1 Tax=Rotaria sordida TaxID=392033 RepID=A0A819M2B0_9BILA|nr:unnamed protein product [Rotaria sordida]